MPLKYTLLNRLTKEEQDALRKAADAIGPVGMSERTQINMNALAEYARLYGRLARKYRIPQGF